MDTHKVSLRLNLKAFNDSPSIVPRDLNHNKDLLVDQASDSTEKCAFGHELVILFTIIYNKKTHHNLIINL